MCKLAFENRMFNSFGKIFTVTTFGESHGPAIGVVVDGVPAGFAFDLPFIQSELDRRKPGQSSLTTSRKEEDQIEVLSGVFENKTTGAPVAMLVRNMDAKSGDYTEIRKILRPGHADLTYYLKYGTRDPNGGGRASARETLARVAAGALAKSILNQWKNIQILAWVSEVYTIKAMVNPAEVTLEMVESNPVRCPDLIAATKIETLITETKKEGNSLGGIITCRSINVPPGLGEPIYGKLQAWLGFAMLGINAVKGIEFGDGFEATKRKGSENNDVIYWENDTFHTRTNHSGGILGGISTGMPVIFNVAFKPTSTIAIEQESVTPEGQEVNFAGTGRHDPCVLPRAVPIVEAMTAIVFLDLLLQHQSRQL